MASAKCRLCLYTQTETVNIFSSKDQANSHCILINKLFSVQIKSNDDLTLICLDCDKSLKECYIFYDKVQKAQTELLEINDDIIPLESIKVEHDPTNFVDPDSVEVKDFSDNFNLKDEFRDIDEFSEDNCDVSELIKTDNEKSDDEYGKTVYKSKRKSKRIILKDASQLEEIVSNIVDSHTVMNKDGLFTVKGSALEELANKFYKLICDICKDSSVVYETVKNLFDHYDIQHNIKGYVKCCNKKFDMKRKINYHLAKHLQPSAFQCHICNKVMSRPGELKFHLQTHLPESQRPLKCQSCNKGFVYPSRFKEHLLTHGPIKEEIIFEDEKGESDPEYRPEVKKKRKSRETRGEKDKTKSPKKPKVKKEISRPSGNTVCDPSTLINKDGVFVIKGHALEKMLDDFYNLYCELCLEPKKFKTIKDLFDHYESEHQTRGYVTCCNTKLDRRKNINYHMAKHIQPSAFECHICKKTVSRPGELKFHVQIHLPESQKPLQCEECGKGFVYPSIFKKHKLSHIPVEKRSIYQCKFCTKSFNLATTFAVHVSSKHSGPKYLCSHCGMTIRGKLHYRNHMKTHEPLKTRELDKVECKECGIVIANKTGLRKHMRRHAITLYCKQCDYVAHSNFQLKKHVMIRHTDIKPHVCVICGKDFKLKHSMKVHMAQHTGERNYSCPYCSRTFVDPANCYSHQKKMHPIELKNNPRRKGRPIAQDS